MPVTRNEFRRVGRSGLRDAREESAGKGMTETTALVEALLLAPAGA